MQTGCLFWENLAKKERKLNSTIRSIYCIHSYTSSLCQYPLYSFSINRKKSKEGTDCLSDDSHLSPVVHHISWDNAESALVSMIIFRQYSKLNLKAFGKIGLRTEADFLTHFGYAHSAFQQLGSFIQTDSLQVIIGRHTGQGLYLTIEIGTAHIE